MDDFNIDEGEAEALLLAIQAGAETIATDDRNAIRASKLLKIDFVTQGFQAFKDRFRYRHRFFDKGT